jgi:acyl carrier protein
VDRNGVLEHKIVQLFTTRFQTDAADLQADLLASGAIDSVRLVELVLELERRFDVVLPFDALEIDDFRTVRRIAELVARTAAGSTPPAAPGDR